MSMRRIKGLHEFHVSETRGGVPTTSLLVFPFFPSSRPMCPTENCEIFVDAPFLRESTWLYRGAPVPWLLGCREGENGNTCGTRRRGSGTYNSAAMGCDDLARSESREPRMVQTARAHAEEWLRLTL